MDSLDKKFYKISEVAEILGIPASTLRFWEKSFTVIKPKRNSHGTRFYTPADLEKISMIHYLVKEKGLKLEAAQEQIRSNPPGGGSAAIRPWPGSNRCAPPSKPCLTPLTRGADGS